MRLLLGLGFLCWTIALCAQEPLEVHAAGTEYFTTILLEKAEADINSANAKINPIDRYTASGDPTVYFPFYSNYKFSRAVRGSFVSSTTKAASEKAKISYKKAIKELRKWRVTPAIEQLTKAVVEYPEFAEAWTLLGNVHSLQLKKSSAREAWEQAVKADPQFLGPYLLLARKAMNESDWSEVERLAEQIISINPQFTAGHLYLGVAKFNNRDLEGAFEAGNTALSTADLGLFPAQGFVANCKRLIVKARRRKDSGSPSRHP